MARKPSKRPAARPQSSQTDATSLSVYLHPIRQAASVLQLDRYRSRFATIEALREAEPPEMSAMLASFGPPIEEACARCAAFIELLDSGVMKVLGEPLWRELRRRVARMENSQLPLIALWVKNAELAFLKNTKDDVRRALDGFAESVEWLERLPEALDDAEASRRVFDAARNDDIRAAAVGTTRPASTKPPFHLTTDLRATSDPLWQTLAEIRHHLISNEEPGFGVWLSLFVSVRSKAHAAGLRPILGEVEYIAATPEEIRRGAPSLIGADEIPRDTLFLIAWGDAGWIEVHDLDAGFTDPAKRLRAVEWAESWMSARERQLVGPAALSVPPDLLERAAERGAAKAVESLGANAGKQASAAKLPRTRRGFQRFAETTTKDQPIIAGLREGKSYREVARECRVGKSTVERVAKAYGLTGHAPETVPLEGTRQENLSIRGKARKRGNK